MKQVGDLSFITTQKDNQRKQQLINHQKPVNQTSKNHHLSFQCLFKKNVTSKQYIKKPSKGIRANYLFSTLQNPNNGHWSSAQSRKYYLFIQIYHSHFLMPSLRRSQRIFTIMQKFIGSRYSVQCRSHHQKIQKKYGNIIQSLKRLRLHYYKTLDEDYLLEQLKYLQIWSEGMKILSQKQLLILQNLLKGDQKQKSKDDNLQAKKNEQKIQVCLNQQIVKKQKKNLIIEIDEQKLEKSGEIDKDEQLMKQYLLQIRKNIQNQHNMELQSEFKKD